MVLELAELLVVGGDEVEGLEHLGLELGLHGGERKRILEIVLFVVEFFLGDALAILVVAGGWRCRGRRCVAVAAMTGRLAVHAFRQRLRRRGLGVRALIGGFEIDDVAEQNLAFVQLVAPDDDGLEGERAFAKPRDHRLAACLDALGDGDLALARQKLDGAHLAQIHAYRIVGALGRLGLGLGLGDGGYGGDGARRGFRGGGALLRLLGLVGVDDVDAHVGKHRHGVLDLLGRDFLGREHLVQLVIGDEPAGLRRLDQLLDRGIRHIQHGTVRSLCLRLLLILCFSGLGCHSSTPKRCR